MVVGLKKHNVLPKCVKDACYVRSSNVVRSAFWLVVHYILWLCFTTCYSSLSSQAFIASFLENICCMC